MAALPEIMRTVRTTLPRGERTAFATVANLVRATAIAATAAAATNDGEHAQSRAAPAAEGATPATSVASATARTLNCASRLEQTTRDS